MRVFLPYLDTELIRNMDEGKIERRVYRKHCRLNNSISYDCSSHFKYKTAAYRFYIKRAFDICSEKYLQNEINTIKHIAIENRFSPQHINKLIYEVKQKNQ